MPLSFEGWFSARHANIPVKSAKAVLALAEGGATLPFIARYRKEQTGNLDEVAIQSVLDAKEHVGRRRSTARSSSCEEIEKQGKLTPELREKILATYELERLEDLYLPYKQKRKTKAMVAREAGLEPLARLDVAGLARGRGRARDARGEGGGVRLAGEERRDGRAGRRGGARHRDRAALRGRRPPRARAPRALRRGERAHEEGREGEAEQQVRAVLRLPRARERACSRPEASHRYLAMRRGFMEEELVALDRRRARGRGVRRAAPRRVRARGVLAALVAGAPRS